jgi:hypothetical protein
LETGGIPYFKEKNLKKIKISLVIGLRFIYMKYLNVINYKFIKNSVVRYNKGKNFYKDYSILPIYLSSRKP